MQPILLLERLFSLENNNPPEVSDLNTQAFLREGGISKAELRELRNAEEGRSTPEYFSEDDELPPVWQDWWDEDEEKERRGDDSSEDA